MPYSRNRQPLPIGSLLSDGDSQLGRLCQHIDNLRNLENKLLAYLDPPLNVHCALANYTNNTIVLHTDSPTWAAKLRFRTPEMLSYMQHECKLETLKTIRIKIIPLTGQLDKTQPGKTVTRRLTISSISANFINNVAFTMSDIDLRTSLIKLGKHNN